jgi:hypothetical protein
MATLDLVSDYITEARRLLQDTVSPFRYPDADLIAALNIAVLEARRLRPELFIGRFNTLPTVSTGADAFDIDPMYRPSFVYYIVGRVELRDSEDTKDARASALMNKFVAQLLTIQA